MFSNKDFLALGLFICVLIVIPLIFLVFENKKNIFQRRNYFLSVLSLCFVFTFSLFLLFKLLGLSNTQDDLSNYVKTFVSSLDKTYYTRNDSLNIKIEGSFAIWQGQFYDYYSDSEKNYERYNKMTRCEPDDVTPNNLKYIVVTNYILYESRSYNYNTYQNTPLGKKNQGTGVTQISTYSVEAFIFDVKTKKCLLFKCFNPESLSGVYSNVSPERDASHNFRMWVAETFNCKVD